MHIPEGHPLGPFCCFFPSRNHAGLLVDWCYMMLYDVIWCYRLYYGCVWKYGAPKSSIIIFPIQKNNNLWNTIIYHIFRSTPIYLCFSEIFSSCVKLCSHFVPVLPPGLLEVPATLYNQRHPEASATAVIFPQCLGCHGSPPLGDFLNWGIPMSP